MAGHSDVARAAATSFRDAYFQRYHGNIKVEGMVMTRLVASIEKELGHRAAPFDLGVRILPVEGFWLHRTGPRQVLISEPARKDPEQLRRLLGPIVTELAR